MSIENSGTGVNPEDLDRIFEVFFTTKSEGMGMGLAICRSIIEAHDGRLWASSGIHRGAVFNVYCQPLRTPSRTIGAVEGVSLMALRDRDLAGNGAFVFGQITGAVERRTSRRNLARCRLKRLPLSDKPCCVRTPPLALVTKMRANKHSRKCNVR